MTWVPSIHWVRRLQVPYGIEGHSPWDGTGSFMSRAWLASLSCELSIQVSKQGWQTCVTSVVPYLSKITEHVPSSKISSTVAGKYLHMAKSHWVKLPSSLHSNAVSNSRISAVHLMRNQAMNAYIIVSSTVRYSDSNVIKILNRKQWANLLTVRITTTKSFNSCLHK